MARIRARWIWLGLGLALSCLPDVDIPTALAPKACGDGVVQYSLGEECDPGGAGVVGCSGDCRIACDGGALDLVTGHCYFTASPTGQFQQALQACKALGGHVVRFSSKSELVFVTSQMLDGGAAWLDLEKDSDSGGAPVFHTENNAEPGWRGGLLPAKSCSGCYANILNPVAGNFPVADGGIDGPCVVFSRDVQYSWFAAPYDVGAFPVAVVCERESIGRGDGPCEAGTCIEIAPTSSSKLYVLSAKPASFTEAQTACNAMVGLLVVLQTPEEREELARALAGAKVAAAWIGLSATVSDAWTWANGKTLASKAYIDPWAEGEPAMKTGAAYLKIDPSAYDTRLAHTDPLNATHPYVCEIALR